MEEILSFFNFQFKTVMQTYKASGMHFSSQHLTLHTLDILMAVAAPLLTAVRHSSSLSAPGLMHRFKACMLLGGVGDALAYNDGKWEFCSSGDKIQEELRSLGGVSALTPSVRKMIVSDDTVMHIATAEAILCETPSPEELYCSLATHYKLCMR